MAKNLLDMEWKNRDCDAIGVRFYPTVPATHGGFAVTAMQIELYLQGYLKEDSDVDGCVGPGTLKALAAYRNEKAIEGVEQALMYLNMRTADRKRRGVEGKNVQ